MKNFSLKKKLNELVQSKATLLWLEGSRYEQVTRIRMVDEKIALSLKNGATRLIAFERYMVTSVGIQFWSNGHPGVLYRWDIPVHTTKSATNFDDDPTPPPHMAA